MRWFRTFEQSHWVPATPTNGDRESLIRGDSWELSSTTPSPVGARDSKNMNTHTLNHRRANAYLLFLFLTCKLEPTHRSYLPKYLWILISTVHHTSVFCLQMRSFPQSSVSSRGFQVETRAEPLSPSSGETPAHLTVLITFLHSPLFFSSETFFFFFLHAIIQAFSVSLNQPAGTHAEATVAETRSNM